MATWDEVHEALTALVKGHPTFNLPSESVDAYAEDLAEYEGATVMQAARQLRKTSAWFPKISELRAACEAIEEPRRERQREAASTGFLHGPQPDQSDPQIVEAKRQLRLIVGGLSRGMAMDAKEPKEGNDVERQR